MVTEHVLIINKTVTAIISILLFTLSFLLTDLDNHSEGEYLCSRKQIPGLCLERGSRLI